jgi:hypothetical protein
VPLPWLGAGIQTVRIKRPAVLVPNKLIRYLDSSLTIELIEAIVYQSGCENTSFPSSPLAVLRIH